MRSGPWKWFVPASLAKQRCRSGSDSDRSLRLSTLRLKPWRKGGASSSTYECRVDAAIDNILSTYRAIMLSLAGNACTVRQRRAKCARIPSAIPSCYAGCSETLVDDDETILTSVCLML